jgi:hypothetical protein
LLSDAAEDEVKRAVIFIHGFNGSARGTWTDFISLVDDPSTASDWWERADLFFFDYQWDSIFRQLTNNTLTIYKFVNNVFPKPEAIGRAHSFRSDVFEYDNLTLVGHSEGGLLLRRVIVRAAQLDASIDAFMEKSLYEKATRPEPEGMLKADIRLFAPALGGDMQSGIVGILLGFDSEVFLIFPDCEQLSRRGENSTLTGDTVGGIRSREKCPIGNFRRFSLS